ncbi:uncharacterized protein LOC114544440 [Dendronephthya gigantea]|uniref:uncharacterized protein LOC114544440 n=1 Tax=Dendronephthya gigantea TaxID=151771 RepID=UPI0010694C35|nr:uncharacterized protein LOC114544440 [Dendronephthya gigantea]
MPEEEPCVMSQEEKWALSQLRESLVKVGERYQVAVPWKGNRPVLANNYETALKRLENTEKRLLRTESLGASYSDIIRSYKEKAYIRKVNQDEEMSPVGQVWFLPHFPVCRPDKETTKTRIVFDASAKHQGVSLNDMILPGPKLQSNLFDVLLRFRRYAVAMVCDIREMYLQIRIPTEDRSYFRFLWRDLGTDRRPEVYEFERVVFGDTSAPFRAQYVTPENARQYKEIYPLAAEVIEKSTYRDDSLDWTRTDEEAIELYEQLNKLWNLAGMDPRKWVSNSHRVLERIPSEKRAEKVDLDQGNIPTIKTLGVLWLAEDDVFSFRVEAVLEPKFTKRTLLSQVSKVFDPLGFVSPFVVSAKIIFQELWVQGIGWDDPIENDVYRQAKSWLDGLKDLESLRIPRCIELNKERSPTVHTFADASKVAYGAVSYLRVENPNGEIRTHMIASKTRVAPLKPVSIPRLELLAAVLGLRLTLAIARALNLSISDARFWCDSMNVLLWIRGRGREFLSFVANRVGLIQNHTSPEQWQYIGSRDNPADLCSRGSSSTQLISSELWWQGPQFLQIKESEWQLKKILHEGNVNRKVSTLTCLLQPMISSSSPLWRLNPERW